MRVPLPAARITATRGWAGASQDSPSASRPTIPSTAAGQLLRIVADQVAVGGQEVGLNDRDAQRLQRRQRSTATGSEPVSA